MKKYLSTFVSVALGSAAIILAGCNKHDRADASADTWEAAKNNVVLAWDKLQASYRKARAS